MNLQTSSRIAAGSACLQLHHIEYNLGYRPAIEPEALRFGTLIHGALEQYWSHNLDAALIFLREAEVASEFERQKAIAMMAGYDARWGAGQGQYEVIAVEREFAIPLVHPDTGQVFTGWSLAGKIDVVARDKNTGQVIVVEHKTASTDKEGISPGSDYWRVLTLDHQVSVYLIALRSMGYAGANVCLYDVLGKPALKPKKATPLDKREYTKAGKLNAKQRENDETADEYGLRIIEELASDVPKYYQRGEVVRLERDIDRAMRDIWDMTLVLDQAKKAGAAPRNKNACTRWNRLCPYFDCCTGTDTLDNPLKFRKLENLHPELHEVTAK